MQGFLDLQSKTIEFLIFFNRKETIFKTLSPLKEIAFEGFFFLKRKDTFSILLLELIRTFVSKNPIGLLLADL